MKLFAQSVFLIAMAAVVLLFAGIIPKPEFMERLTWSEQETQGRDRTSPAGAQPVSVIKAQTRQFVDRVRLTGSLVAREELLVSPQLQGYRIVAVKAAEGDYVARDQILVVLEDTQIKTLIDQNDAAMARADAAIAQAKNLIAQARATNEEAQEAFERASALQQKGHVSSAVLDAKKAAARTAAARLAAARDGLQLALADKARIGAQRRELDWRLSNTRVRAPGEGIISRKTARVGALVSSASPPLFHIVARGEYEMEAEVSESDLPRLKKGLKAEISLPGMTPLAGRLRLILPEVNALTRLGHVRIFIGAKPDLRIGTFARAVIETARSRAIGVPLSAVQFGKSGGQVQIVRNNRIVSRPVTTGIHDHGWIEITSGLNEGDLVVARAGTFLSEGDAVKPVQVPPDQLKEARR